MIESIHTLHGSRPRARSLVLVLLLGLALPACGDNLGSQPDPKLTVVSVSAVARVQPGGSLSVTAMLRNSGENAWPDVLRLEPQDNPGWEIPVWQLPGAVPPGTTVTVTQTIHASTQIGFHTLTWLAAGPRGPLTPGATPAVTVALEVTCDDGVFCNGDERYVNGACAASASPCDDGVACSTEQCDEERDGCVIELGADCPSCNLGDCRPDCTGKECGSDGCRGTCGAGCADTEVCVNGTCSTEAPPGTCLTPRPLLAPDAELIGTHVIMGDTSIGLHEIAPTCNPAGDANEQVYTFTIDRVVGIDARMSGYDTVLELRLGDCRAPAAAVACSDDATPPSQTGSRIATMLQPGTYYLIADGYNRMARGPFTLSVRFTDGCVPQCDGRFCGDDACGGQCGECAEGQACAPLGRCLPDPCTPACEGRECGGDGCNGTCGSCSADDLCIEVAGQCRAFPACDHDRPTCEGGCSATQFCGVDCQCHEMSEPRIDLTVGEQRLASDITFETRSFDEASCAVVEGCVGATGERRLLRFTVLSVNQGLGTFEPPAPEWRPDLFEWSLCHGHYHFKGFARYAVLDQDGNVVVPGRKQAYCMTDSEQVRRGPTIACGPRYNCYDQGLQAGWADSYPNGIDCQWLDVTGVAPGEYWLQVELNPDRLFDEVSYENNTSRVPVTIE
ncbi:MAG TPA: lysyl oxidase family protein [Haliangium sp.]|nr:lysyl oxidase family protein [Haliangium sp.]